MTVRIEQQMSGKALVSHRIGRRSLVDGVVEHLRSEILRGALRAGEALPTEQDLCIALGVSRTAVREALNRLATERLVSFRHSGAKRVLDYRRSAGLELLAALLVDGDGRVDPAVVRSVMEMRSAVAPDVARLAAERRDAATLQYLREVLEAMRRDAGDLSALQDHVGDFWDHLVEASGNVAYRLAYNSLRASYDASKHLLTRVLAGETSDVAVYSALCEAVERRDAPTAESLARSLVRRGEESVRAALSVLDFEKEARR
jgi:GntR family transcriptional repressor for pyruvate dehydrogenase complex